MNKSLLKWIFISALVHGFVIIATSFVPVLISLLGDSPSLESKEVSLTEEIADWEDNYRDETLEKLTIDPDTLNIDVVKVSQIKDRFKPEVAEELIELIRIYDSEKLSQEEINREKSEIETTNANKGLNVINTYPLGVHANVILENLDFTKEFDAEISFRVNNDGGFRSIEVTESSGWEIIDKSLENIFKELSAQKVAFFTNFRRMNISVESDGEDLTLTVNAYLRDGLIASSTYLLLKSVTESAKSNNKDDEETMTILNNLRTEQRDNAIIITVDAKALFVKEAIKD